jgi:predicted CXXCH cytochrome family protein
MALLLFRVSSEEAGSVISRRIVLLRWSQASLLAMLGVACTDEKIVFREPVNPPPDASSGFLGYFTTSDKQTTCGNCHVGMQGQWENTRHAGAYETLAALGDGAQGFCFGCHTVNQRGNATTNAGGWDVVQDTAYHDVQCESCHGPGQTHVENPDATQPLASIRAATDADNGCGECHSGVHHPFVDEWEQSKHAAPNATVIAQAVATPASYAACLDCHSAQGALRAWGINADFIEKDAPIAEHLGIVCAVCHDPHGSPNSAQLRFPIDVASEEQNLCVKCHHKRAEPETQAATLRGPHSPEGPLLLGEGAGWFPPNFQPEVDRILSTHGSVANPRLCATCHVAKFTVTDQATGEFVFNATGHLFNAIPCVDAQGIPTTSQECDITQRTFTGCTTSGCHGTEETARSAFLTANQRITDLAVELDAKLALPGPAADLNPSDGRFTVADGANFNSQLAKLPGSPTHNPFLMEQLLVATIDAVNAAYGLPATSVTGVSLKRQLK